VKGEAAKFSFVIVAACRRDLVQSRFCQAGERVSFTIATLFPSPEPFLFNLRPGEAGQIS